MCSVFIHDWLTRTERRWTQKPSWERVQVQPTLGVSGCLRRLHTHTHTHGFINHFLPRLSFQSAPDTDPAPPPLPPWPAASRSSSSPPAGSWPGRGTVQRGTPPWRKYTAPVLRPPAAHWSRWGLSSSTRCSFLQEGWQHWSSSNSHCCPTRHGPGSSKWKCSLGGLGEQKNSTSSSSSSSSSAAPGTSATAAKRVSTYVQ